jgi:predicted DNA-binding protein
MGEDRKFKKFSTSLPPDIYARLEKYCEDDEREKSWVIKKAVDIWLKDRGY